MSESYPEPQVMPETVGGRLVLVIALELSLLLGGTYGAWRFASSRGMGVKARPAFSRDDDANLGATVFMPMPMPPPMDPEEPPTVAVTFHTRTKFGIERVATREDKRLPIGKLTSSTRGISNRTTVRIDGETRELGTGARRLDSAERPGLRAIPDRCWVHGWDYPSKVRVTQAVMLLTDDDTKRTESVMVRYLIENHDEEQAHSVALRFLLDTHVGDVDGVPFLVPGRRRLLAEAHELRGDKVPCFIQALERTNLSDPGTVATLTLRSADPLVSGRAMLEPADRIIITGYPEADDWEIEKSEFRDRDSCVALYWSEQRLAPGKQRVVGFLYGQGTLFTGQAGGAELAVSYGPKPLLGMDFDIVAWVKDPAAGQLATIELPAECMKLADPKTVSQPVRGGPGSLVPISWRVKVDRNAQPNNHLRAFAMSGDRHDSGSSVRFRSHRMRDQASEWASSGGRTTRSRPWCLAS